jgi:hypothetical protein
MGTLLRTETLTHRIGTDGRVSVKTLGGTLRVRGVEGDEARLTVTYKIRASDQAAAERALETGRVLLDRGPGSLEIETPDRRLATGLAWLFGGMRVGADISLDVPWGTKVRYETMSGAIEAASLVGDQRYRTVSGDIRLWTVGGLVDAGTVSGSIVLDQGGDVRLRANTVSGRIRARARRFYGTLISTTSGNIIIVGALDSTGDHRAESISGGVELTPLNGVTCELRAISGSITSDIAHRLEGGRGYWRSIVGDGAALFKVNSTSGGLRLRAPRAGDTVVVATAPATTAESSETEAVPGPDAAVDPSGPEPAPPASDESDRLETEETWNPDESGDSKDDEAEDEELAVLQALERGEIGVDEAAERLERTRD